MILVCGPTGSGKTSTLYALLRSLNASELNIVTIEDPVEIEIAGATQIPVDDEKGNTFSALLRSVLRQDPDVILVGEIRDAETARIAMQAAITGHLVFSTVHTKDTIGTVYRLLDLGVEPYLLAQGLHDGAGAAPGAATVQHCRSPRPITPGQQAAMGKAAEGVSALYVPVGCRQCLGTGYAGRRPSSSCSASTRACGRRSAAHLHQGSHTGRWTKSPSGGCARPAFSSRPRDSCPSMRSKRPSAADPWEPFCFSDVTFGASRCIASPG